MGFYFSTVTIVPTFSIKEFWEMKLRKIIAGLTLQCFLTQQVFYGAGEIDINQVKTGVGNYRRDGLVALRWALKYRQSVVTVLLRVLIMPLAVQKRTGGTIPAGQALTRPPDSVRLSWRGPTPVRPP